MKDRGDNNVESYAEELSNGDNDCLMTEKSENQPNEIGIHVVYDTDGGDRFVVDEYEQAFKIKRRPCE